MNATKERVRAITASQGDGGMISIVLLGLVAIWAAGKNTVGSVSNPVPIDADALRDAQRRFAEADRKREIEARERKLANDRAYEEWLRTQPVDDLTDADRLRIGLAQGAPSMAQMFQGRAYVRGHFKGCDTYVRGHFRGG